MLLVCGTYKLLQQKNLISQPTITAGAWATGGSIVQVNGLAGAGIQTAAGFVEEIHLFTM